MVSCISGLGPDLRPQMSAVIDVIFVISALLQCLYPEAGMTESAQR